MRLQSDEYPFDLSAHSGRRERCDYLDRDRSKQTNRSRPRLREADSYRRPSGTFFIAARLLYDVPAA
jgi:hypothetical protein